MTFSDLYVIGIKMRKELPAGSFLNELPIIKNLKKMEELTFSSKVTFLVGENGVGKSTLIEAIAIELGFNPEGGTKNFCFNTRDSHSELDQYITVIKGIRKAHDGFFLRAESFYNVASNIDDLKLNDCYGGASLHRRSHGEGFLDTVENRFGGNGIYILDEPEAALSPSSLLRLMCDMNELVKVNSQFIIATHSPILMAFPESQVLLLSEEGISQVDYKETDHYLITKRFLDIPEKMCRELFD